MATIKEVQTHIHAANQFWELSEIPESVELKSLTRDRAIKHLELANNLLSEVITKSTTTGQSEEVMKQIPTINAFSFLLTFTTQIRNLLITLVVLLLYTLLVMNQQTEWYYNLMGQVSWILLLGWFLWLLSQLSTYLKIRRILKNSLFQQH